MTMQRRRALAWLALVGVGGGATGCAHAGAYDEYFTAIVRDQGDAITALLRRGFDPNTRDAKGQVGLTLALSLESMSAFQAILQARGVQVEARNAQDESALMMAAIKGNLPAARALIAKDADVNKTGWTPLHYAASCITDNAPAMITLLLENHAYIDAGSPNGTTPLMMAARGGHIETVKLLLDEGADMRLKNQQGMTVIDFAERYNQAEIASGLKARWQKLYPQTPIVPAPPLKPPVAEPGGQRPAAPQSKGW